MSEEETEGQGFVIKDHRHSHKSDEDINEDAGLEVDSLSDGGSNENIKDIQIDFSTFILSLTSSAFYHLGDVADPQSGEKKVDLVAVKQTIDILSMLNEKTIGNLSNDEKKLLEQLVYELQMKYVAASKES